MLDVEVIEDPAAATVALEPVRSRLLAELAEPASAATLAGRLGIARQRVNYHLRALESHAGNQRLATRVGFEVLWSHASTDAEWDAHEDGYLGAVERHAAEHPDDPEVPALLERSRAWHRTYRELGKANLGFGLYLLRRRERGA